MKFTCSHCGQEIQCDELWSGHEIQCPTCSKPLMVPPKREAAPDAAPHANLASAKASAPRLSIGASKVESAANKVVAPQVAALEHKLSQTRAGRGGAAKKWITVSVVILALAVGAVLGYPYVRELLAKRAESSKPASAAPTQEVAAAAAPDGTAPAADAPKPEKPLPLVAPTWTLDAEKASIPKSRLNGTISGTNFVSTASRFDKAGTTYLLRLLQGTTAAPDLGFMIYLRPKAGESVTNRTWTIAPEMRGSAVPQVVKLWKKDPRYQASQKSYSSGYVMKLELGEITNGTIAGKIYLAVPPDTEQTVIAGSFKAETSLGDPNAAATAGAQAVAPVNPAPAPADPSALDRRYGTKR